MEASADQGVEVHAQPYSVFLNHDIGYELAVFKCPGCQVRWWIEPTNDQTLAWARDGVA